MRIMMMTNTYLPHVGGVARSVAAFTDAYRAQGHDVLVVAPEFAGVDPDEQGVVRVSAVQNFNGSDFSMMLPDSGRLTEAVERFQPEIIHSHHPFLVGSAALRLARQYAIPLVFTHHTMYEEYTHYVPVDSPLLKRFVATLSTHYANNCHRVFAPRESVAATLVARGVTVPIEILPTGVRTEHFTQGHGRGFRAALGIPREAFVVGHVGRLAPEKNLEFLTRCIAGFLAREPRAVALVVGSGPCVADMRKRFQAHRVAGRAHLLGSFDHPLLVSAYRAMDVFAFASKTETQGMVLTEAMAASVPVVALDAPGAREVVADRRNGRLLAHENEEAFVQALAWCAKLDPPDRLKLRRQARATAVRYALPRCAARTLGIYAAVTREFEAPEKSAYALWDDAINRISAEWTVLKGIAGAAGQALASDELPPVPAAGAGG
ncbi:MAG: glycosyltransferase [Gammaproteobacteria bacterium]|nr:glycosyltransferase [Gammaproteobacteria bacterium]